VNPDPDTDAEIRSQGFDEQKLKKTEFFLCGIFFDQKLQFTYLLSHYKGRPSFRRSLQPSKENIQHFKKMKFINFFLLWVIFALLDPDSDCESGYGSKDPTESGSNPDPDPQH
jgi:hypothetical protein